MWVKNVYNEKKGTQYQIFNSVSLDALFKYYYVLFESVMLRSPNLCALNIDYIMDFIWLNVL